jgi:hypothetical protein
MRWLLSISLAFGMGVTMVSLTGTEAEAQRYRVYCAVRGTNCIATCGSNTYTVACYARIVNGRCQRWCGRVR